MNMDYQGLKAERTSIFAQYHSILKKGRPLTLEDQDRLDGLKIAEEKNYIKLCLTAPA